MREIIFRGIPKDDTVRHFFADTWKENCEGSFVYGSLVVAHDRYYICVSAMCSTESCINNGLTSMIKVIPSSVSEFTGCYDKNGKKIFEGDVVIDRYSNETFGFVGVVIYNSQLSQFQIFNEKQPGYVVNLGSIIQSVRIIGNIHDNPELLRKEDEGK